MAAGLLFAPTTSHAACGLDGIPEQYRPLDLSEGEFNSFGQPVIGGEAASTRVERECREENSRQSWSQTLGIATDENTETLKQGIEDQFTSGSSYAYNILRGLGRKAEHVYDPDFNASKWIDDNREALDIQDQYMSTFMGAVSASEARAIASDITDRQAAQKRIQRMGTAAQLAARAVAGLPDLAVALSGLALLFIPVNSIFRRTSDEKPMRATAGK